MISLRPRALLACLSALILAGCATVPPPAPGFGPVPAKLQTEIDAFYTSLDRSVVERNFNGLMQHYTADVEYSYRAFYPSLNERVHVHRNPGEVLWYYQINLTSLEPDSLKELRQDFEYEPGPTRDAFQVRYKSCPCQYNGKYRTTPYSEVTIQFRRSGGKLQIRSMAAENLDAPNLPAPPGPFTSPR